MKHFSHTILSLMFLLSFFLIETAIVVPAFAADTDYTLLVPLPDGGGAGGGQPVEKIDTTNFPHYINNIIRLIIAASALLAVLMIVIGGFKKMIGGVESINTQKEGSEQIRNAILGFLLLLGSYLLLSIINPDLLNLKLTPTKIQVTPEETRSGGAYTESDFERLGTKATPASTTKMPVGTKIPIKTGTYDELELFRTNCAGSASRIESPDGTGVRWLEGGENGKYRGGYLVCS